MRIGYWNIHKQKLKSIGSYIASLLSDKKLDVLFLSEFQNLNMDLFSKDLDSNGFRIVKSGNIWKKILPIVKVNSDLETVNEGRRWICLYSKVNDLLLVALHLEDQTHRNDLGLSITHAQTLREILEAVHDSNHTRVAYLGDFNCMPYSNEMLDFNGLHGVLFKSEMKTNVGGRKKNYNPTLLALNEEQKLYGSFRYTNSNYSLYWYAFDQVVVSEELVDEIHDIDYLKEVGGKSLLSKRSRNPLVSDHLPLVFEIV